MDAASAVTLAATDVALNSGQLAALKAEINTDPTARGYAGKDVLTQLALLCEPYTEANPTPQGTVPRLEWPMSDFYNFVLQQLAEDGVTPLLISLQHAASNAGNPIAATVAQNAINYLNSPLPTADLTNTGVVAGLNALLAEQLITSSVYHAIFNMPDPIWTPTVHVTSRVSTLSGFANGDILTARDIADALAS